MSMSTSAQPINLFEFEELARERLPKEEYDYIAGGAGNVRNWDDSIIPPFRALAE